MTTNTIRKLSEVTKRVELKMQLDHESLTSEERDEIFAFLEKNHKNEFGIRVIFTQTLPVGDYTSTTVYTKSGNYVLSLLYGKNMQEDKYPNVLFVGINKTPKAKFKVFWERRGLPKELFEEVSTKLNLSETIFINSYKAASEWNASRVRTACGNIIGQKIDAKGSFIPNKPIGYIVGNGVSLTNPKQKNSFEYFSFN